MKIIVQKFGGTSVRNEEGRNHALRHIRRSLTSHYKVVVVVSAMGRLGDSYATDTLLSLVGGSDSPLSERERDMLLAVGEIISAVVFTTLLLEKGIQATALTGGQAGFRTTSEFGNAKIIDMQVSRLLALFETVDVVVVTGFQGVNDIGDVTTLGRGGSDTSATALGAALNAEYVDIFTDVEGIMTADPRISKLAKPITTVSYLEVCNMAYQGANVIHPRAVEIAMSANVPIRIRSTATDGMGTLVTTDDSKRETGVRERLVTGIAHLANITQVKIAAKENQLNLQTEVFSSMANAGISVDFINIYPSGVQYTIAETYAEKAEAILLNLGYRPQLERKCAKISIIGAGIAGVPGITAKIVTSLANREIQIFQSADSQTTIWVLIHEADLKEAIDVLHEEFQLGSEM